MVVLDVDGDERTLLLTDVVRGTVQVEFARKGEASELTPTLKVKRKFCTAKYSALLDQMYDAKAEA